MLVHIHQRMQKPARLAHCLVCVWILATQLLAAGSILGQQQLTSKLPGLPDPDGESLKSFLLQHHAEVNVAVRRLPSSGRSAVAPRDFQTGDVFARVPLELTYAAGSSIEVAAHQLLIEMAHADHPWGAYFRVLPGPSEVLSGENMPTTYLPILQDPSTERAVLQMQRPAEKEWRRHSAAYWRSLGPGIILSNITYAMSLISTRWFNFDPPRVVPFIDFANHNAGCKHTVKLQRCPGNPNTNTRPWANPFASMAKDAALSKVPLVGSTDSESSAYCTGFQCGYNATALGPTGTNECVDVVWTAGEPVEAGQEVCYGYRDIMLQDNALIEYGFLQEGPIALELGAMDRHERRYHATPVWALTPQPDPSGNGLPLKFQGTSREVKKRKEFLQKRLNDLLAGEPQVAAVEVDTTADPEGRVLAMMLEWRQQRLQAIRLEIQRLQHILDADNLQEQSVSSC